MDMVVASQVRELHSLNHVGPYLVALNCELVSQANCLGAVRSGRGDEHLDVYRLREIGEHLFCLRLQFGRPNRDV